MDNLIIRASAGTGKTYQLSKRYLQLLFEDVGPESILATTFTKKAAGEIQNRILKDLAKGAQDKKSSKGEKAPFEELEEMLNSPVGETNPCQKKITLTLNQVQDKLYDLIKNLNRLNISTLDSYFNQIAQCFSLELGLPMDWEIMDEYKDKQIRTEILNNLFKSDDDKIRASLLNLVSDRLSRSIFGKVRNIVNDIYNIWREAPDSAWEALKVPEKEISDEEFDRLLQDTIDLVNNSNLTNGTKIDCQKQLEALKADMYKGVIDLFKKSLGKTCFIGDEKGVKCGNSLIKDSKIAKNLISIVNYARRYLLSVWRLQTESYREILKEFDEQYMKRKKDLGCLIFDDIPCLLSGESFSGKKLNTSYRMDGSINHLMLDEFQDTSLLQWRVLEPMAKKVATEDGRSFFCVGDDKQAIYGWRGGEAELLNSLESLLKPATINSTTMGASWRSGQSIMTAVNDEFSQIDKNEELLTDDFIEGAKNWHKRFVEHKTAYKTAKEINYSYVELSCAPYDEDISDESKKELDELRAMKYRFVARKVQELYEQSKEKKFEIGVLTRSNKSADALAREIKNLGLECSQEGKSNLLDSYSVCQILGLLKWIDHPGDKYSQYQTCRSRLKDVIGLKEPLFDDYGCLTNNIQAYSKVLNELRYSLIRNGYGATIEEWAEALKPEADVRGQRLLDKLIDLANSYDPKGSTRTEDFIDYVENTDISDAYKANIRVMTYHQAKGLEFDIVVLPELDSELVQKDESEVYFDREKVNEAPNAIVKTVKKEFNYLLPAELQKLRKQYKSKAIQEALCNLYVAMTRAKRALYMIITPPKSEKPINHRYEHVLLESLGRIQLKPEEQSESNDESGTNDEGASAGKKNKGKGKESNQIKIISGKTYYRLPQEESVDDKGVPYWIALAKGKKKDEILRTTLDNAICFDKSESKLLYSMPATSWSAANNLSSNRIDTITVSARVKSAADSAPNAAALEPSQRGSLLHLWLSGIKWIDQYEMDKEQLIAQGLEIDLNRASVEPYLAIYEQLLKQLDKIEYFRNPGKSWDVYQEKIVAGILKDSNSPSIEYVVSGVIDRLILHRDNENNVDKAIIYDYKTVMGDKDPNEVRNHYANQMEAYRKIIAQTYHIPEKSIETSLIIIEV